MLTWFKFELWILRKDGLKCVAIPRTNHFPLDITSRNSGILELFRLELRKKKIHLYCVSTDFKQVLKTICEINEQAAYWLEFSFLWMNIGIGQNLSLKSINE